MSNSPIYKNLRKRFGKFIIRDKQNQPLSGYKQEPSHAVLTIYNALLKHYRKLLTTGNTVYLGDGIGKMFFSLNDYQNSGAAFELGFIKQADSNPRIDWKKSIEYWKTLPEMKKKKHYIIKTDYENYPWLVFEPDGLANNKMTYIVRPSFKVASEFAEYTRQPNALFCRNYKLKSTNTKAILNKLFTKWEKI
jgi:hypothetical protein